MARAQQLPRYYTGEITESFTDTFTSIEWARGSWNADIITGTAGIERIDGRGGNDHYYLSGGGADILNGGGRR